MAALIHALFESDSFEHAQDVSGYLAFDEIPSSVLLGEFRSCLNYPDAIRPIIDAIDNLLWLRIHSGRL